MPFILEFLPSPLCFPPSVFHSDIGAPLTVVATALLLLPSCGGRVNCTTTPSLPCSPLLDWIELGGGDKFLHAEPSCQHSRLYFLTACLSLTMTSFQRPPSVTVTRIWIHARTGLFISVWLLSLKCSHVSWKFLFTAFWNTFANKTSIHVHFWV